LLSIGVGSALIILYDYLENPHLISREQAFEYALKYGGFNKTQFVNETVDMKLLQTKTNGVALVLDDKTLKNEMNTVPQSYRSEIGEYVWQVLLIKKLDEYNSHEWRYFIDAFNGTLIDSGNYGIVNPRTLNQTSP
jgi:hypothetical protein